MSSLAYASIWLFVFSIPWSSLTASGGVAVISKVTGVIALAFAVLVCLMSGRVRRLHPFHVAALLFVTSAGLGLLLFQVQEIPNKFYTFIQLLLAAWGVWQLAPTRRQQLGLLNAYVLGAYVAALGTILLYMRERNVLNRFAAGGADPNDLAMTLALAIPMAWYLGFTFRQPLLRWICRGYLVVGVLGIGLTGSRGGMLTTLVALMIVPLTLTQLSPNRRATAILLLVLAGGVAVTYVPDKVVQRLATTSTEVEDLSIGGRFKMWVAGLRAFTKRPVMGYGPGTFKGAIVPYLVTRPQVAHNSYVSVLVEEGVVGFLLYALMVLTVFRAVLRLPQLERRYGLVLLATLAVAMTPLTWEDHKPVWFVLAALAGLAGARTDPRDERAQSPYRSPGSRLPPPSSGRISREPPAGARGPIRQDATWRRR